MGNSEVLAYAVRLLARRAFSRGRLRAKLLARFPEGEVEEALARLEELGYLGDRAFAETFVAGRRKYGPRKLRQLLLAQGVPEAVVAEVLREAEEEVLESALRVLRRYPRRHDRDKAVRFLQGRGFPLGVALEAYRLVKEEESG